MVNDGIPHKAVAEVSKIGKVWESLVLVNHGWQNESTLDRKVVGVVFSECWLQWLQRSPLLLTGLVRQYKAVRSTIF